MPLASTIRERRKQLGLTQVELARIVGVRQATISDFEHGKHGISSDALDKILQALDLAVVKPPKVPGI